MMRSVPRVILWVVPHLVTIPLAVVLGMALARFTQLESDRTSYLERRVEALTRGLAQLRHDLPRLIEQAQEPRVRKLVPDSY